MKLPRPSARHARLAFYLLVALVATAPAWIVEYPPMTDLPYHLATMRVIHSLHDPRFGLAQDFELTLGRTQYVLYYVLGSALAYLLGVVRANVVLMSAYLGGTVLAMRALLRALHKDERLCLFVIPLLFSVLFMFGLFPFLVGMPLMFWALALAIEHFEDPTPKRAVLLGVVAIALFYTHVVPFGLFGIGCVGLFPWSKPSRWVNAAAPLVPSVLLLAWWASFTEAGKITRSAAFGGHGGGARPLNTSLQDLPNWLFDIFRDTSDEKIALLFAALVVITIGLAQGDGDTGRPTGRGYVLVPLACFVAYFVTSEGQSFIWPLAQRFPALALLTAVPLLRMPRGLRGVAVSAGALAIGVAAVVNVCTHFVDFQLHEVGDLDDAIEAMAPQKKVCALIYDRGSSITNQMAFLHFGSYYQVAKGGVVMFTFAGYPHWPFTFKPGRFPPPGGPARPRWEWTPQSVSMSEIYPYYDYVLVRGVGFDPPPQTYRVAFRGEHWTVWQREGGGLP